MVDITKYVRSKTQKLLSSLDAVLNLPMDMESGDRGMRNFLRSKTILRPEEAAYEAEFTGDTQSSAGLLDVESLASVLACVGCDTECGLPLTSCRKAVVSRIIRTI